MTVTKKVLANMLKDMGFSDIRYSGKKRSFFYTDDAGKRCLWKLAWLNK